MPDISIPILQSGFYGYQDTELSRTQIDPMDAMLTGFKTGKFEQPVDNPYFCSEEVCALHLAFMTDRNNMRRFEFREKVLLAAMRLLSPKGKPVSSWFAMQAQPPGVSDLHIRFLIETLDFVAGKERTVSLDNWHSLLFVRRGIDKNGSNCSREIRMRFEGFETNDPRRFLPHKIDRFLVEWTSRPGGFYDLLSTLNVFFGKHALPRG